MLKRDEQQRYSRQMILPEFGLAGQESLKAAKVLMVGAGGLGCPVLQYLTAAGVGIIGVVDHDVVDISNLHRQILYNSSDVGRFKAVVAKQKLELLNPHITINAYPEKLTPENAGSLMSNYDLVVDGSDDFTTRYLVNDVCVELGKPLVFGSVFKFEGHVAVFNYHNGPGYRDIFAEAPPENEVPNCAETGVIGVLPGMVGTYMANEAIKIICGMGEVLSGKFLTINSLDNSVNVFNVTKQTAASPGSSLKKETSPGNYEISMDEANQWLAQNSNEVYLVDVRETYEYDDYNIGGVNIPLYELTEQAGTLPVHKKVIFCCQTGQRSKMAVQLLKPVFTGEMYSIKNGIF
ncbi:HesA/MoeB/ThiF family protein [Mucilaginibacter pocheonensis]|uniref:Adenylyltransferase/sulfurtransferase n=1 Tax=Mucilaginibacter pocheonensis TaxID=398050 RepID=A0ABU1TCL3_9SPHI|nr:HesA/MoeB/ThiF family protein [Mucilaginibacter pocheonensis]MDR6943135.1 adenylyltransferase/sulfurtransferase [Mucilaginibacter pocheonensis]